MGRFKKTINNAQDWCEDNLRQLCGRITEDQRIVIIILMLLLFAFGSLYITLSSIYNFGKGKGEEIQIQHIERMQLELYRKDSEIDSLKQINKFYYEGERYKQPTGRRAKRTHAGTDTEAQKDVDIPAVFPPFCR